MQTVGTADTNPHSMNGKLMQVLSRLFNKLSNLIVGIANFVESFPYAKYVPFGIVGCAVIFMLFAFLLLIVIFAFGIQFMSL